MQWDWERMFAELRLECLVWIELLALSNPTLEKRLFDDILEKIKVLPEHNFKVCCKHGKC
eukprot:5176664-Amphidinium_carterae.1